jgi:hypothetical protein
MPAIGQNMLLVIVMTTSSRSFESKLGTIYDTSAQEARGWGRMVSGLQLWNYRGEMGC